MVIASSETIANYLTSQARKAVTLCVGGHVSGRCPPCTTINILVLAFLNLRSKITSIRPQNHAKREPAETTPQHYSNSKHFLEQLFACSVALVLAHAVEPTLRLITIRVGVHYDQKWKVELDKDDVIGIQHLGRTRNLRLLAQDLCATILLSNPRQFLLSNDVSLFGGQAEIFDCFRAVSHHA